MSKLTKEEFEEIAYKQNKLMVGVYPCDCGERDSNRVRYFNWPNYSVRRLIDCGCNFSGDARVADLTFPYRFPQ